MANPSAPPDDSARANASRELAQIEAQTLRARSALEGVQADITDARVRLSADQQASLRAVNQQLLLTVLRSQAESEAALQLVEEAAVAKQRAYADYQQRYSQLSQANEQLVLAAIDAQELQAASEQAQRRQADLLAMVAHELRHPLAPIRNAAAVLSRIPDQPPVLGRMQAVIERQITHMSRLVGDLLDTTRASTGKLRIDARRIDMADIIEDVLQACKPAMDARFQQFTGPQWPLSLPMDGDPLRLTQILSNLLDNASKYTPDGGEILLSVAVEGRNLAITISDSGIGITPDALARVFEPFVQDHHATVFHGAGLGLGLTVVRELVHAHGGTVVASSDGAGLGSCFVVTLPLAGSAGD